MDITENKSVIPVLSDTDLEEKPGVAAVEPHCPKCTGPMVRCSIGRVGIYGWWLERATRPAGALGPSRAAQSDVDANCCLRCGFTEFYAKDPRALLLGSDDKH